MALLEKKDKLSVLPFPELLDHPDLGEIKTHTVRATWMNCQHLGRVWKLMKFYSLNFHQEKFPLLG